jgi:hypothetical protein
MGPFIEMDFYNASNSGAIIRLPAFCQKDKVQKERGGIEGKCSYHRERNTAHK